MKRSTFKVLFFLKRDKQKTNGTVPLYCRITVDGSEARFGMKCDANPKLWDVKTGKASGRTVEAGKINSLVDSTKAAIFRIYRELQERDNYVSAEKIKNVFLGVEQKSQTLLELFDCHNRERKKMIGINICQVSYDRYLGVRELLAGFLRDRYNVQDIPVRDVSPQFIREFEAFLYTQKNRAENTVVTILKKLRHVIGVGINREWITKNPFREHRLRMQEVPRGFLTQREINTLIDFQFGKKHLEITRDLFIFCVFTGLSYSDLKSLSYDHIQSSFEGKPWIRGNRCKTGIEYKIPLLNIPKMIIEKYRGKMDGNTVLPVYPIQNYNRFLKQTAKECGIAMRMSSHLARHTFATLALTRGVSIESVSKMLGHGNIKTTQIYSKVTENKIGNEMDVFAGNVRKWDTKLQLISGREETGIEKILQALKITAGKKTDGFWKDLVQKIWNKMSSVDRQVFASEMKEKENKPGSLRDFYISLMDYFLDTVKNESNAVLEKVDMNMETQFAVNF
ncbi:MAG: site-specific integrase [Tannerella sp.]|jgi:site-specific recombinase XerD|nr:site-specific integrase [Tannerella sp.]